MKNKTAVARLIAYIRTYHSREPELIEYAETLLEEERAMTTDWPEHGERYYEKKYGNEKTSAH